MVIWLIGMSASGKTTIGKKLFERLANNSREKWLFLDGDMFRNIFGEDIGHSLEDRNKNAYRISRFCEYLDAQGINVVACVLSIFHDNQRYNRERLSEYKEVFIDVEFEKLVQRDNKKLYKNALDGKIKDVVGVDIDFIAPYAPDIVINNNKDFPDYEDMITSIVQEFQIEIDSRYEYTAENRLDYPHKYQYSKFEGKLFFEIFFKDRKDTLSLLSRRKNRLELNGVKAQESQKTSHCTDDTLILKDYLNMMLETETDLDQQKHTFKLLLQRFEVAKKLYMTYSPKEMRKICDEYEVLINYPLFSLVLQKYYKAATIPEQLIYANALLKVNDIISSIADELILPDEVTFAMKAVKGELEIFEKFTEECL